MVKKFAYRFALLNSSLVRLLIAKKPLSEKQIGTEIFKLAIFSGILAIITAFMMGVTI